MIGRYLIYTPAQSGPNEKRFDSSWRRFAEICRSLHRDGLTYSVQLNLTAANPHVLITASGQPKPRKHSVTHRSALPPPIPAQRCRERALEAEWFLPEKDGAANLPILGNGMETSGHNRKIRGREREVGKRWLSISKTGTRYYTAVWKP